jgi:hypothetical protein
LPEKLAFIFASYRDDSILAKFQLYRVDLVPSKSSAFQRIKELSFDVRHEKANLYLL